MNPKFQYVSIAGLAAALLSSAAVTRSSIALPAPFSQAAGGIVTGQALSATDAPADLTLQGGHTGAIHALAFDPAGRLLSASEDGSIRMWDPASGNERRIFKGHSLGVRSIAISPQGDLLASGSDDRTVRIWNTTTGKMLHVLHGHDEPVVHLTFSPDGTRLLSGGESREAHSSVRLWDPVRGILLHVLSRNAFGLTALFFDCEGRFASTAAQFGDSELMGQVRTYDLDTGTLAAEDKRVIRAASPDGRWIAIQANYGADVEIRRAAGGGVQALLPEDTQQIAFSPNGEWVSYTHKFQSVVSARNLRRSAPAATFGGESWRMGLSAVSDGGEWVATVENSTIKIRSGVNGELRHLPQTMPSGPSAFSPDGRTR